MACDDVEREGEVVKEKKMVDQYIYRSVWEENVVGWWVMMWNERERWEGKRRW